MLCVLGNRAKYLSFKNIDWCPNESYARTRIDYWEPGRSKYLANLERYCNCKKPHPPMSLWGWYAGWDMAAMTVTRGTGEYPARLCTLWAKLTQRLIRNM